MILVTGAAGFIGMHVCEKLLDQGEIVLGIDDLNNYYDVSLKQARLDRLKSRPNFIFDCLDISDRKLLSTCFSSHKIRRVVHLAAQAGVRHSITNPYIYGSSNMIGFLNILEGCRNGEVEHLVYASSSSVYGSNRSIPFSESDSVNHPVSLYAATKQANELMAHSYSHLYQMPSTGLRLFTAYGPWGRPDMSPHLFARAIFEGKPISVFNNGKMRRDFTYIDDISEAVARVLNRPATINLNYDPCSPIPDSSSVPWRIFNVGNHETVELLDYIKIIENKIGKKAIINLQPMQSGDVLETYANTTALKNWIGFSPSTSLEVGIEKFVDWMREYYKY